MKLSSKVLLASILTTPGLLHARNISNPTTGIKIDSPVAISAYHFNVFESSLKDSKSDKLEIDESSLSLGTMNTFENLVLLSDLTFTQTDFTFTEKKPFSRSEAIDLTLIAGTPISKKIVGYTALFASIAADKEAGLEDGFTWGGGIGYEHEVNNRFSYVLGLMYHTELENDSNIGTIASFTWLINDNFTLESDGNLGIYYDLNANEKSVFSLSVEGWNNTFRLKNNATSKAVKSVMEEKANAVLFGYDHKFENGFSLHARFGITSEREFTYRSNGKATEAFKIEKSAMVAFAASYSF